MLKELGLTQGRLVVRKKTDDSGDRERVTYDILSCFEWGCNGLVYEMDNPNDARLFAHAPKMLMALIEWVFDGTFNDIEQHEEMIALMEDATGKTWNELVPIYDKYIKEK